MALQMIYGRSGTGKTQAMFDLLKKSLAKDPSRQKKRYVIVPDQFSYMMEKQVLQTFGPSQVFTIQVLGFSKLAQLVLERVGGIRKPLMGPIGRSMLAHRVAKKVAPQLTLFRKTAPYPGFAQRYTQMIRDVKAANLTSQDLKAAAQELPTSEIKQKLEDMALLFDAYETRLHEQANKEEAESGEEARLGSAGFIDTEDQLDLALKGLKESDFLKGAEFYFDEFSDFTAQQLSFIEVLMTKGPVTMTLTLENGLDKAYKGFLLLPRDTDEAIYHRASLNNISILAPIELKDTKRFQGNEELEFLESEFYHYPAQKYNEPVKKLAILRAQNPFEEVELVAKDIRRRVREENLRYNELAILLGDLSGYQSILPGIMAEYNIPIFLDARKSIDDNPLVAFILAFFAIHETNWDSIHVLNLLKTNLLDIPRETIDVLENYVLAHGLNHEAWQLPYWKFDLPYENKEKEGLAHTQILNEINDYKSEVVKLLTSGYEAMNNASSLEAMAAAFYEFLRGSGVLERVAQWIGEFNQEVKEGSGQVRNPELARQYKQVLDSVITVLDQLVEAVQEPMSLADFGTTLTVGLQAVRIALIPATLDQVIVGDVNRVRSGAVRGVYLLGANDGVLPKTPKEQGLLTDADVEALRRIQINLGEDRHTKAFYEQFHLYNALTTARDFLTVSYPAADAEGKALRPSVIISRLQQIFPKLVEQVSPSGSNQLAPQREELVSRREAFRELIGQMRRHRDGQRVDPLWQELYAYFSQDPDFSEDLARAAQGLEHSNLPSELRANHMDELYGKNLHLSVSRLEEFNRCPFAYFIQFGMKAKERQEYLFDRPALGSLVHEVIEHFTKKLKEDEMDWSQVSPEYTNQQVERLFEAYLSKKDHHFLNSSKRQGHVAYKIKRLIASSIEVIASQISQGEFEPLYSEVKFGQDGEIPAIVLNLDEDRSVNISGRIDRVDVLKEGELHYIRVIDYKTGGKELKLEDIAFGLQMQLMVYLDVILRHSSKFLGGQAVPGAVLYFNVSRPLVEAGQGLNPEELAEKIQLELRLNGFLLKDAKVLVKMDPNLGQPFHVSLVIPATTVKDGNLKSEPKQITQDDFQALRSYVTATIESVCEKLLEGNINITPTKKGEETACQYCKFHSICQFDPSQKGNEYRNIPKKMKRDELWNIINKGGRHD